MPPNTFGATISKLGVGGIQLPTGEWGQGGDQWRWCWSVSRASTQTEKPPGSLLTGEASLCVRLGYYPSLYLHLIKVHFVKYNIHSMMCLLYKEKVGAPSPDSRGTLAHVNTGLGWASLSGDTVIRCTVDTAPHRMPTLYLSQGWGLQLVR